MNTKELLNHWKRYLIYLDKLNKKEKELIDNNPLRGTWHEKTCSFEITSKIPGSYKEIKSSFVGFMDYLVKHQYDGNLKHG